MTIEVSTDIAIRRFMLLTPDTLTRLAVYQANFSTELFHGIHGNPVKTECCATVTKPRKAMSRKKLGSDRPSLPVSFIPIGVTMLVMNHGTSNGGIDIGMRSGAGMNLSGFMAPGTGFGYADIITDILAYSYHSIRGFDPKAFYNTPRVYRANISSSNRGNSPVAKGYESLEDARKYTTSVGSAFSSFAIPTSGSPKQENMVRHLSIEGRVKPRVQELYTYEDKLQYTIPLYPYSIMIPDESVSTYSPIYYNVGFSPFVSFSNTFLPGYYLPARISIPFEDQIRLLNDLQEEESPLPYVGYNPNFGEVFVADVKTYGNYFSWGFAAVQDFTYISPTEFSYVSLLGSHTSMRRLKVHVIITNSIIGAPVNSSTQWGRNVFITTFNFRIVEDHFTKTPFTGNSEYYGWNISTKYPEKFATTSVADTNFALSTITSGVVKIPDLLLENSSSVLRRTEIEFSNALTLARPSCMLSYSDAIGHYRLLAANYIEVLTEMKDIVKLFPDLVDLLSAFYSGIQLDPAGASYHLANFFSSSYLKYKFGWSPNVQNAKEITERIDLVGDVLKKLQSPSTHHGRFDYQFDTYLGIDDVKLTTRTKVRLPGVSDDFVLKTLELDSLGLLPRTSNVWDLVPWSWFLDYFYALGQRYEIIDSVFLGIIMNASSFVHSYQFTFRIPESTLAFQNIRSDGAYPEITIYFREVSRYVPMIFESRYDFGANKFPPDRGILAAIVWTLLSR